MFVTDGESTEKQVKYKKRSVKAKKDVQGGIQFFQACTNGGFDSCAIRTLQCGERKQKKKTKKHLVAAEEFMFVSLH